MITTHILLREEKNNSESSINQNIRVQSTIQLQSKMNVCTLMFGLITVTVFLLLQINFGDAFNLSPKPNFIFHEPEIGLGMSKIRSSYFGFTLNLKQNR